MTDQMHDGKCNELLVREETIHGRGPAEAACDPNLLASLRFLRLAVFFPVIIGCCESSCSPASLPPRITIPEIDRRGGSRSVHGEIQFREETNVLHRRKDAVVLGRSGEENIRTRVSASLPEPGFILKPLASSLMFAFLLVFQPANVAIIN